LNKSTPKTKTGPGQLEKAIAGKRQEPRHVLVVRPGRTPMAEPKVWVFFYGSYMNFRVLQEVHVTPEPWEVARLHGFDIRIQPRANLVPSEQHYVYGIVAKATHAELARLYAHARDVLGEVYLPEAVLVQTRDGLWRPALCYLCPEMAPQPADYAYVERISGPAREFGFPEWYIARLESFRA
jgi:hypothetical protein